MKQRKSMLCRILAVAVTVASLPFSNTAQIKAGVPKIVTEEAEWEGAYQFGDAPSGIDRTGAFALSSVTEDDAMESRVEAYLYQELLKRSAQIDVYDFGLDAGRIRPIVSGLLNEHPELYFVKKQWSYTFILTENGKIANTIACTYHDAMDDAAFHRETRAALSVIRDGMNDLQKAIALHDYLVVNCEYDNEGLLADAVSEASYTAYGALVQRIAVCEGYALAYKYLLNQAGIPCYMVTSQTMNHAWNMVELDGKRYQVDVTWDDPVWDRVGRACHGFMFKSDAAFERHSDWQVTHGSETVDYKAVDTTYDDAFWSDVDSPLILAGERWDDCYYAAYEEAEAVGKIKKAALSDLSDPGTAVAITGKWPVWESANSHWKAAFSGLFQSGGRLYYNDATSIYSIKLDGTDKRTEFTPEHADGYLYGSAMRQGKVVYAVHQSPTLNEKETVFTADIVIEEEAPFDIAVERVQLDEARLLLAEGDAVTLQAIVTPAYATDAAVSWESSNPSVARVQNGAVTAVSAGTCTVTASAGGKTAVCSITVVSGKEADDLAYGRVKNIIWRIDADGKLTVEGTGDFSESSERSRTPWYAYRSAIVSADIRVSEMTDASYLLFGCTGLEAVRLDGFDSREVTNMKSMFERCSSLRTLDLSGLSTENVTDMSGMFLYCSDLERVDFGECQTAQVTDLRAMFGGCLKLIDVGIEGFDTSNVTNMNAMFSQCAALTELDLSGFDLAKTTDTENMFAQCGSLARLTLPAGIKGTIVLPEEEGFHWKDENDVTRSEAVTELQTPMTYRKWKDAAQEPPVVPVTDITLSQNTLALKTGETAALHAAVLPENATEAVSWESSDASVASVENGTVKANAVGECRITAFAGEKEAVCLVTVSASDEQPDKPIDPNPPTDPDKPTDPNPPTDPDKPIDPNPPTDPNPPIDPDKPANPNPPTDSEKPANPNPPSDSAGIYAPSAARPNILVNRITLTGISKKIAAGKSIWLTAGILPQNADNAALRWSCSNPRYASVTDEGKVSIKKKAAGKRITITAEAIDGSGITASYTIRVVKDAVKKVRLLAPTKAIKAGKSLKIKASVTATGKKSNRKLLWSSSNPSCAVVSGNGKVKTMAAGKGKTVTITARSTDGTDQKASVRIKLK